MKKFTNKDRRKLKIRNKVKGTSDKPRFSVYRSNKHIVAQLIDDENASTLVSVSTMSLKEKKGTKTDQSFELGKILGEMAKNKKIKTVCFDRGSSKYHGRVKSVADGARESGLEF